MQHVKLSKEEELAGVGVWRGGCLVITLVAGAFASGFLNESSRAHECLLNESRMHAKVIRLESAGVGGWVLYSYCSVLTTSSTR